MYLGRLNNFLIIIFLLCSFIHNNYAQDDFFTLSSSGLLLEADKHIISGDHLSAIPYLTEYLERVDSLSNPRILTLKQNVRLNLGQISAYINDSQTAVKYLSMYIDDVPCYYPRKALGILTEHLYEISEYEKCIETADYALTQPLPKKLLQEEIEVDVDLMSRDQLAGLSSRQIKRIEKEAEKKKSGELAQQSIMSAIEDENNYTIDELVSIHFKRAESCKMISEWEKSIESYKFVIDHLDDESRRGYAILQLINSLIALERYDDAKNQIISLYKTNARYDIRVNMAIMTTASILYNVGEFDSALLLYRMVLPREELISYQEKKMNKIRREIGLPDVKIIISTNEFGRSSTLFLNKGFEEEDSSMLPPKPEKLMQLEESVNSLNSLPAYEDDVIFKCGLILANSKRPWESIYAFDYNYSINPDSDLGQRAFAESLFVLLDPLLEYQEILDRGNEYLKNYNQGLTPRRTLYAMTLAHQRQTNWYNIKNLKPLIEDLENSDDKTILRYECELFFIQAIADMVLLNYFEARSGFDRVLVDYPGSHQQENASYWHAMSQVFLKNYSEALDELFEFESNFPNSKWLPSVIFHQGICYFGLEKYEDAKILFTKVISEYYESDVCSDALSMRADLYASEGILDEAEIDYYAAIENAVAIRQDTYAVFQLASMLELEDKNDQILNLVDDYLKRNKKIADVAKASFWIGKIKISQGLLDEAIEVYKNTIFDFGHDINQDGVDLIISELVRASRKLTIEEKNELIKSLDSKIIQTNSHTLKLRLRVLGAEINGNEIALGEELIIELNDLNSAPPPVLAIICKASFVKKDFSRADEILELFLKNYEDSELMKEAYKLSAHAKFNTNKFDHALDLTNESQALYGTEADVSWTQILKGRIFIKQNLFDEAEKAFKAVLTVNSWRGAPYAEAMYYLGKTFELKGEYKIAAGWFQRTYFQYKAHAKGYWSAESYLSCAECLRKLGRINDSRNTLRCMLFDSYVNKLPQSEQAKIILGKEEVEEINNKILMGESYNPITNKLERVEN